MAVNNAAAAAAAAAARAAAEAARRAAEAAARAAAAARAKAQAQAQEKARAAQAAAEKKRAAAAAAQQKAKAAQQEARQKADQAAKAAQQAKAAQAELATRQRQADQHPTAGVLKGVQAQQKVVDAALASAKAAQAASTAAASTARALTEKANASATQAIQAEQKANGEFTHAGLAAPYSAANTVHDAMGAAQLSAANQSKILGSTMAVSDAAKADAARLQGVRDPVARTQMLASMAASGTDPLYQKALVEAAGPQVTELSHQIVNDKSGFSAQQRQQALDTLTGLSEKLKPDAQQALATAFATGIGNANVGTNKDNFGTLLKNSITSGHGASFGAQLASALQGQGKTETANTAAASLASGIHEVTHNVEESQKKVEELKARMNSELATWKFQGKDLATEIKAFKERTHFDAESQKLEDAARVLASTVPGATVASNDPVLKSADKSNSGVRQLLDSSRTAAVDLVTKAADTVAGSRAIGDAVRAEGEGDHTFIGDLKRFAEKGEKGKAFLENSRTAIINAVGAHALASARAGDFRADSKALLAGLSRNEELLGIKPGGSKALVDALGSFKPGMSADELKAAAATYGKALDGSIEDGKVATSFKALGVLFGAANAVSNWKNFSEENFRQQVTTIAGTLQLGQDGASLVTSGFTRFATNAAADARAASAGADASVLGDASTLGLASKVLSGGLAGLGTVVSGWNAVDAFSKGHVQEGIGNSLSAVGGAILFASTVADWNPVGWATSAVGGVLVAAGALVSLFAPSENPFAKQEGDLKAELKAIGANDHVAEQLKSFTDKGTNWGSWVSQVAQRANMPTGDLVRSMNNWSPQQLSQFLDAGRLQLGTDDNNSNRLRNASAVLGPVASKLEDAQYNWDAGSGADAQYANQVRDQKSYRAQVNEKTGEITYRADLVQAAANWASALNHQGPR